MTGAQRAIGGLVAVPVYNEAANLQAIIARLKSGVLTRYET